MKNLWNKLKPDYQLKIRKASHKYDSARRLKYTLMAASGWYDLKLNDIRAVLVYTDKHSYDVSGADIMYGNEFIKIEYYD
tara:strand:+ start:5717 stop:5956 length:240 start_codon:yes stop_codon:yes gene_type:complete